MPCIPTGRAQITSNVGKYVEQLDLLWECQMMQSLWVFAMVQKVHSQVFTEEK